MWLGHALAQLVDGARAGDGHDPGQGRGAGGVVVRSPLPRLEEDLLEDVLGRRRLAEHAHQEPHDRAPARRVQLDQRLLVAALQPVGDTSLGGGDGPVRGGHDHGTARRRPPDYGVAGTRTRLIVWITPLVAWMLIPESTRRGSRSAGRLVAEGEAARADGAAVGHRQRAGEQHLQRRQLLARDHVVEQHVADLVDREGGEDRVERGLLARGVGAAEVGHEALEGAVVRGEDGEGLGLVGERRREPGRGDGRDQQVVVVRVAVGAVGARRLDGDVDDRAGRRVVVPTSAAWPARWRPCPRAAGNRRSG